MNITENTEKTVKNSKNQQKTTQRYLTNPFLDNLIVPIKGRQVQISRLGADDNILINQRTGENLGMTSVVSYKKVDSDQFVKLFTKNIKLAFELTQAGQKALYVVYWAIQKTKNNDFLGLDQFTLKNFLIDNPDLEMSLPTFKRGLGELVKNQIIALSERKGFYFINPSFVFNGDRVAFTTVIERDYEDEE